MVGVPENEKTGPEVAILTQKKNSGEIPVARVWRPAAADGGRRWRMVAVATVTAIYFHITKPAICGGENFRLVNSVMVQSIHRLTLIWFGDCYCLW